jgi:YVTN family beta-propeller protein
MHHLTRRTLLASAAALSTALAAGSVLATGLPERTGPSSGMIYTADEHGHSISALDLEEGAVTTVPIAIAPHNVQITADGRWLLAVGKLASNGHGHGHGQRHAHAEEAAGRLLVFDADDVAAGPVAEIPAGDHPAHVVADADSARAFVTSSGDDAVTVIDLVARGVVGAVATGADPHGLRPSPDGREL